MANLDQIAMNDVTVLKLDGNLNADGLNAVADQFETVTGKPGVRVVVDLSGVQIVTTPAISMFLAATAQLKRTGGRIIFTQSQPPVSQVLQRLKLHAVLQTTSNLDEALTRVRQPE